MQVSQVMTKNVTVVDPDCRLVEVARKMKFEDIGCLPVCTGERLLGMVTDRDIVLRAVANDMDVHTTTAHDVMSEVVCYCYEDQDIHEAAEMMEDKQIRRLVVLNRNKKLAGIVSLGDLASRGDNIDLSGEILKSQMPVHLVDSSVH
jgi:CBS domain-containing protein